MLRLITFTIAFLVMIIPFSFVNSSNDPPIPKEDIKLVLIGIAVDSNDIVLQDVKVELNDIETKEIQVYVTNEDGQFQFNLQAEKNYKVCMIGADGNIVSTKEISTINKTEPEVLHIMLNKE